MRPHTLNLPSASKQLVNNSGCLTVHATRETTGTTAAVYRFWDGSGANGTLIMPVSLTAGESTRDDFHEHHIVFRTGLYYELVSGTLEGSVSLLLEHECERMYGAILDMILHQG